MKNFIKRLTVVALALVMLLSVVPMSMAADEASDVTILFTHDLHSHLLPSNKDDGGQFGGYARLMTAIDRERVQHPKAILVDAGDFSIGSLFQTLYTAHAAELRTMGAMGYDAVTAGNHEFDHWFLQDKAESR